MRVYGDWRTRHKDRQGRELGQEDEVLLRAELLPLPLPIFPSFTFRFLPRSFGAKNLKLDVQMTATTPQTLNPLKHNYEHSTWKPYLSSSSGTLSVLLRLLAHIVCYTGIRRPGSGRSTDLQSPTFLFGQVHQSGFWCS
jgi:hypothetical protein